MSDVYELYLEETMTKGRHNRAYKILNDVEKQLRPYRSEESADTLL